MRQKEKTFRLAQLGPMTERGQARLANQRKTRLMFRRSLPATAHLFTVFVTCIFLLAVVSYSSGLRPASGLEHAPCSWEFSCVLKAGWLIEDALASLGAFQEKEPQQELPNIFSVGAFRLRRLHLAPT